MNEREKKHEDTQTQQLREEVQKGFDQIDRGEFSTRSMDELSQEAMRRLKKKEKQE